MNVKSPPDQLVDNKAYSALFLLRFSFSSKVACKISSQVTLTYLTGPSCKDKG